VKRERGRKRVEREEVDRREESGGREEITEIFERLFKIF